VALLVQTAGANVSQIVLKTSGSPVSYPATRLVTAGNIHVAKPRNRKQVLVPTFTNQVFSGLETSRGNTGDLTRITSAIQRARAAFDYVPNAAWMAALADGYENQMEVI